MDAAFRIREVADQKCRCVGESMERYPLAPVAPLRVLPLRRHRRLIRARRLLGARFYSLIMWIYAVPKTTPGRRRSVHHSAGRRGQVVVS
jgi:hypothetical protein